MPIVPITDGDRATAKRFVLEKLHAPGVEELGLELVHAVDAVMVRTVASGMDRTLALAAAVGYLEYQIARAVESAQVSETDGLRMVRSVLDAALEHMRDGAAPPRVEP